MTDSTPIQFILASASPRRAQLLSRLAYRFEIAPSHIDESRAPGESPEDYVRRMAREKAAAGAHAPLPVLGADTTVVLGDRILGKPQGREDALDMLAALSGSRHAVLTAVCLRHGARSEAVLSRTWVNFAPVSPRQAAAYWASGESEGKAGGYAIQGLAEAFVSGIEGSYSGVVGLPLQQTASLLKLFDIVPGALPE